MKVWDVATGTCVLTLRGHTDWVESVCVSPDGLRLFSGSRDKTIMVWDVATGACVQTLEGHTNSVTSVCLSGDGAWLFSGSDDKTIKVWNVATGACVQTLRGHTEWVRSVCVSADGLRLFSGSKDKTIKMWSPLPARWHSLMADIDALVTANVDNSGSNRNLPERYGMALLLVKFKHYRQALMKLKAEAKQIGMKTPEYEWAKHVCEKISSGNAEESQRWREFTVKEEETRGTASILILKISIFFSCQTTAYMIATSAKFAKGFM